MDLFPFVFGSLSVFTFVILIVGLSKDPRLGIATHLLLLVYIITFYMFLGGYAIEYWVIQEKVPYRVLWTYSNDKNIYAILVPKDEEGGPRLIKMKSNKSNREALKRGKREAGKMGKLLLFERSLEKRKRLFYPEPEEALPPKVPEKVQNWEDLR